MSRGRYRPFYLAKDWNEKVVRAGKCQLFGPLPYRPLFTAIEFPSIGFRRSVPSWLADAPIEAMSNPEHSALLYLHTFRRVTRIFSQVGLDPTETRSLSQELDVDHPAVKEGDVIMSTDFVVEINEAGVRRLHAYSVKRAQDLDERVMDKLAIEEAYWTRRDIPWTLLLDTELPQTRVANMELVFDFHDVDSLPCPPRTAALVAQWLHPHAEAELCALRTLGAQCDRALQLERGTSLAVAYHSVVNHAWSIDWDQPILPILRFAIPDTPNNFNSAERCRPEVTTVDIGPTAEECHGR